MHAAWCKLTKKITVGHFILLPVVNVWKNSFRNNNILILVYFTTWLLIRYINAHHTIWLGEVFTIHRAGSSSKKETNWNSWDTDQNVNLIELLFSCLWFSWQTLIFFLKHSCTNTVLCEPLQLDITCPLRDGASLGQHQHSACQHQTVGYLHTKLSGAPSKPDPINSFLQTFLSKSAHFGGCHPSQWGLPPKGKSLIRLVSH